jgi:hypothetical protein
LARSAWHVSHILPSCQSLSRITDSVLRLLQAVYGIDRCGVHLSLSVDLVLQMVLSFLPMVLLSEAAQIASSIALDAHTVGVVPLVLRRVRAKYSCITPQSKLAHGAGLHLALRCSRLSEAYGMSLLFEWSGRSYRLLFIAAAAATTLAIVVGFGTKCIGNAGDSFSQTS